MISYLSILEISIFVLAIILSIGYIILLTRIIEGWDNTEIWGTPSNFSPSTKVSIIIAARNEEENITQCLKSILNCLFPHQHLEIIVVNDHSSDTTAQKVKDLNHPCVTLINLTQKTGKKNALTLGIENSSGNIIGYTDADCIVPKNWLMSFVSYFELNGPKCIAGPITYLYDKSTLQRFQYIDALNNMCVTANGIQKGIYYMANGANLFFSKQAFDETGGYNNNLNLASGDDMFLIQAIANLYPKKIAFLKSPEAIVQTQPEKTFSALKTQRTRWATKSKSYTNKNIMRIQGFVFVFVVIIILNLILSPIGSSLCLFGFLFALFIKWTMDYLYLSKIADFFNDKKPLKSFFGASIGFIGYILFAGWKALRPTKYNWKGRETN